MNSPYEQALDRIDGLTRSRDQIEKDFYRLRDELSATRNELTDTQKSLRDCIKDADRYETLWTEACDKLREKNETIEHLNSECGKKASSIYALRNERNNIRLDRDAWKAEAERWRKLSENTSLGRIEELEAAVNRWETACRAKDADIDKLLAERDEAIRERDTERRRANHNIAIAVEREGERKRLETHIQKQHVASWHLVQDALGTDFRVNGNSLVEDTVNAINGFRDACELLDLIHDATNLREEP